MPGEDKPFDPTPSRLQKARREGNVARSTEINTVASFGLGALAIFAALPLIHATALSWFERAASLRAPSNVDVALALAALALVPAVAALVAGVTASIVQAKGLLFVMPSFKPERLKPSDGFKRMFSPQSAVSAAKALLAFAAALACTVPTAELVFVRGTGGRGLPLLAALATLGAQRVMASAVLVALLFCVADYLIVRRQWLNKLKMSLYELKKEMQESEGNPQLRGRRRQRHRQLVTGPIASVASASFVVANPTHIAVALRYAPPEVPVPLVLVMGADEEALRIRSLAAGAGIPIVADVALARSLWETATVGASIPRESFVAVAEIVTALSRPARRVS